MHPPFLFFLKKRNGPCTVQREIAWAQNGALRLICLRFWVGRDGAIQTRQPSAGCARPGTRVGLLRRIWGLRCMAGVVIARLSATSPAAATLALQASGSGKERWSLRSLPVPAIPIRVAQSQTYSKTVPAPNAGSGSVHPRSLSGAPRLVTTWPIQVKLGRKAPFLLTVNGRFLFGKTKRKWGFSPVPQSGTFPALRPWPNAFRRYRWSERPAK